MITWKPNKDQTPLILTSTIHVNMVRKTLIYVSKENPYKGPHRKDSVFLRL